MLIVDPLFDGAGLVAVFGKPGADVDVDRVDGAGPGGCGCRGVPDPAVSVGQDTEKLVAIIELKNRGSCPKRPPASSPPSRGEGTSAIFNAHGLSVADLVLVSPGSIPITTSGKVRRATCVEQYRCGQAAAKRLAFLSCVLHGRGDGRVAPRT